jgi:hypothetical protein
MSASCAPISIKQHDGSWGLDEGAQLTGYHRNGQSSMTENNRCGALTSEFVMEQQRVFHRSVYASTSAGRGR